MTRGVCLIAYGEKAECEAAACLQSLRQYHDWPYAVASEVNERHSVKLAPRAEYSNLQKSRYAKVTLNEWTPFDETLYLDADTRVQGDLRIGFEMLDDGWQMVMTASTHQDSDNLWHVSRQEREETYAAYQCASVLQLQGGVFWFRKCQAIADFFAAWRAQWQRYECYDQAALLRALRDAPVKLFLLGRPYNGGAVVQHHFGRAVR